MTERQKPEYADGAPAAPMTPEQQAQAQAQAAMKEITEFAAARGYAIVAFCNQVTNPGEFVTTRAVVTLQPLRQ